MIKTVKALLKADHVVVFTGAGMSADSGLATFRHDPSSYWSQFNPRELASPEGWRDNHCRVWAWYEARRAKVLAALPHQGHMAVAELESVLSSVQKRQVKVDIVTQNVDNLHERAGCINVTHLHGSLFAPVCSACYRPGEFASEPTSENCQSLKPPTCKHCGGRIRPGVVWFGENLPKAEFDYAHNAVMSCDVVLVIGTSGVVWPAAELPLMAREKGKFVAEINPIPSGLSRSVNEIILKTAQVGMTELLNELKLFTSMHHQ